MTLIPTVQQAWLNFFDCRHPDLIGETGTVVDRFGPEIGQYCEFVQGAGGWPVGLMIRGEGAWFTTRTQRLMAAWGMPVEGLAHHLYLAELFEHKRAFLKLEWHQITGTDRFERLVAFYFRRRPSVKIALEHLQRSGVRLDILQRAAQMAQFLEKDSVHFVAAALRPGQPIHYKLYFSQYVTPQQSETVLHRLLGVMAWLEINPGVQAQWAALHRLLVPPERTTTLFVSISFTKETFIPSVKFDYADVLPQTGAKLTIATEQPQTELEMGQLCRLLDRETLSYLGVRYHRSGPLSLKYYADFMAH